jgi:glycyl-tRNA synthetase beta subunit
MAIAIILTGLGTLPAHSVTESVDLDSTSAVFEAVRRELTDEDGGVNYLKTKIESGDFAALLEFTKTYDQVLRKGVMGKAKKVLTDSDSKERATAIANNVTFDLIGINRSSRKGQEDITQAKKYLEELQDDIRAFLDLEPKG